MKIVMRPNSFATTRRCIEGCVAATTATRDDHLFKGNEFGKRKIHYKLYKRTGKK